MEVQARAQRKRPEATAAEYKEPTMSPPAGGQSVADEPQAPLATSQAFEGRIDLLVAHTNRLGEILDRRLSERLSMEAGVALAAMAQADAVMAIEAEEEELMMVIALLEAA